VGAKAYYIRGLGYLKPYKKQAILSILLTIPVGSMDAVIAWSLKPYLDTVMLEKQGGPSYTLPLVIIIFSLVQSVFSYYSSYLNSWVGTKVTMDLKKDLFSIMMKKDSVFFDKRTSGDVQMRFNTDAENACNGLLESSKVFLTKLITSLSLTFVLAYNSMKLAIVAISVLSCALYPVSLIRAKIKEISRLALKSGAMVMSHYNEAYMANRVIASYNLQKEQNQNFSDTLNKVFKISMKRIKRTGLLTPMMHLIVSFGIAAVIYLGHYLISSGQLTTGGFVSFIAALLMLYTPMKTIGNDVTKLQLSTLAMERVFSLLDDTPKIKSKDNSIVLDKLIKNIHFDNVNFSYSSGRQVLKDVNLEIKAGQNVAFVGNSGGGKTTIINLLSRFYDVKSGSIMINGIDIRDIELNSLRKNISMVFQDNILFSGTIRDNILVGKKNATKKELEKAINNSCLSEFIASLPKGLETEIGERGILLSGGQRQRIGIARAFLKNSPIVVLDEATSALDNKSEAVVQQAIYNLMEKRTVLVIAHRLSTIKNADKIFVINKGQVIESGTHDELLLKEGSEYALLYNVDAN
jgi:subfamily B ATP-binding cassette protein MsbA